MCVTILFVQEQLLTFLPNIQFTVLLLVLYASLFTFRENMALIFVHVLLDNLYMGTFNPFYMTPMFIGWTLIPIAYHTFLKETTSEVKLAIFGLGFGFVYGWVYIPFYMLQTGMTDSQAFYAYLIADIPFEIIMAASSFFTILWLYKPLYAILSKEMEKYEHFVIPVRKHH